MNRLALVFLVILAGVGVMAAGRTDPYTRPHRPTAVPTATLTTAPPTETAPPQAAHVERVEPSATPYPTIYLCQVCIDVSGTPQWPNACIATQFVGGSCAPTETATPDPYP